MATSDLQHLSTLLALAGVAACQVKSPTSPACPEGTTRQGAQCLVPVDLAPTDPRVVEWPDGGATPVADGGSDAGLDDGGGGGVALPFFIEDHYVMSGFFSESGAPTVAVDECSGVSGTKPGATCKDITFSPNGDTYGGFFFQHPENNFGRQPGLPIQAGARQVRFRAWGAAGGERMKFGAGIDNQEPYSDGFNVERSIPLTNVPTEYYVDLREVTYARVAGGFFWVAETPTGTGSVRFFIDNIEWTTEAPAETGVAVPFWVDDHFAMSGFFPGPPGTMSVQESCPGSGGTDPSSTCRTITFTPNGGTFGGFYFQYPENNFGASPGLLVAPGATRVTFRAWGQEGGEVAKFGAGVQNDLPSDDGWSVETAAGPLSASPMELSVDIAGQPYDRVVGAFFWVVETPDGRTPVTIHLDNVRWQ